MALPIVAAAAGAKFAGITGVLSSIGSALVATPLRAVLTGAVAGKLIGL